jgi:hypothetical protein
MEILSYFILLCILLYIYKYKNITLEENKLLLTNAQMSHKKIKEHFFGTTDISIIKIYIDIFQSIYNISNPYINLDSTIISILSSKCYVKYINNIYVYDTKPWLRKFNLDNIISFITNINNKLNISVNIETTTIINLNNLYITNFLINTYNQTKMTNYLYHYYNTIININSCIDSLSVIIYNKIYDTNMWITMFFNMIINNNLIYFDNVILSVKTSSINDKYNTILIISTFILDEIKKYAIKFHEIQNDISKINRINGINIRSTVKSIRDILFYNDDGNYFINNFIFDCSL